MFGWRGKFLFMLIVYFAGFATAVYFLAPATQRGQDSVIAASSSQNDGELLKAKTQRFAGVAGVGIQRFASFAEEKALEAGRYIKAKLAEYRESRGT